MRVYDTKSTGIPRGTRSNSPFRSGRAADSFRPAFYACTSRACLQEEIRLESKSQRTQAKGQALGLGPRFPRHGLVDRFGGIHLADEFFVSQALAGDLTYTDVKAFRISHLAIVESESLFIDATKQVERFYADVGPVQSTLQRPEVFHRIGVDVPIHVFDRVIDDLVLEGIFQAVVRLQFVGEYSRSRFDVLTDIFLKFLFASIVHHEGANVSAALHHTHYDGLIFATSPGDDTLTFVLMHVARFTADEGLIDFHFACQLATVLALLGESDSVQHEPRSFLSDTQRPCNFATADAVLAIQDKPHCRKPLIETQRRVLKNGSDLDGELTPGMPFTALPPQLVLEETNPSASALRAGDPILPLRTASHQVLKASHGVREVNDSFLKGLGPLIDGFHISIVPRNRELVKYIIALIWWVEI